MTCSIKRNVNKKLFGLSALLLALPIGAACYPNTAEAPLETTPEVGQAPTTTDPAVSTPATGEETIAQVAANDTSLSTFNAALESAGLTETLSEPGPYTVFAPSDEAFDALPQDTLQQLLLPENQDQLRQLLSYHVVPEDLPANQLETGSVETLAGAPLSVEVDSSAQAVTVNNAVVTQPNLSASNGVIHVVDQVILPPTASR
ncbi:beta-Ig-H3/fasciclin [filamentous cyanobacterium CCT1]|nr:beta-Ig-H3/fasciclin [filamentous cyanobacterium CCT1]PSN81497.1 beta-Ig-H3/fasciclin [filamentous cyanobacterium CCP4]